MPVAPAASRRSVRDVVQHMLLFEAGWFACVLGAAHAWPWAGPAVATGVVGLHVARAARPAAELRLVGAALFIGALLDGTLGGLGLVDYRSPGPLPGFVAPWILALWALFATLLNVSLAWLKSRPLLAAALGAVGGPLSYYGGEKLGALTLAQPAQALAALAIGWAIAMPLLAALARRYDGIGAPPAAGRARLEMAA